MAPCVIIVTVIFSPMRWEESADGDACPEAGADVAGFGGELERWAIRKETNQHETDTSAPW